MMDDSSICQTSRVPPAEPGAYLDQLERSERYCFKIISENARHPTSQPDGLELDCGLVVMIVNSAQRGAAFWFPHLNGGVKN